jgi:hypothetical protein
VRTLTGFFETRAVNLFAVVIWPVFLAGFIFCLYGCFLYLTGAINNALYPLLALMLIVVPLFTLFSLAAFPKIKIENDVVILKYGFMRMLFFPDEVQIKAEGRVLRLGNWMTGGWYVPFRREECIAALEKIAGLYPPKAPRKFSPWFYLYFLPIPILYMLQVLLKQLSFTLNPMIWALLWEVVVTFSLTMTIYNSPLKIKIWGLNKASSSLLFGLFLGITAFLFMMLTTS